MFVKTSNIPKVLKAVVIFETITLFQTTKELRTKTDYQGT